MPNAVLEALALGRPIIASDIGPHRELVGDPGTGLLFPVDDPAALAAAMRHLLDATPAERDAWQAAAHTLRPRLTLAGMIDGYEHALRLVAEAGP